MHTLCAKITSKSKKYVDDRAMSLIYVTEDQFTHRRHDTTRQHATRPVFLAPHTIKWISSHILVCCMTMSVVTTNSCCNKNRSGSDFCHVSQRQYQENC